MQLPRISPSSATLRAVHRVAGVVGLATIGAFWLATIGTELRGVSAEIIWLKRHIPWGLGWLVPALLTLAATGARLGRGRGGRRVEAKRRRMPWIGANGLLLLVPAALFLAAKARAGELDAVFVAVQVVELVAGAVNLVLLGSSFRDGLVLAGRLPPGGARDAGRCSRR